MWLRHRSLLWGVGRWIEGNLTVVRKKRNIVHGIRTDKLGKWSLLTDSFAKHAYDELTATLYDVRLGWNYIVNRLWRRPMKITTSVDLINKTLGDGGRTKRVLFGVEVISKNAKNGVEFYCKTCRLVLSL